MVLNSAIAIDFGLVKLCKTYYIFNMIDRVLIDTLKFKAKPFAQRWVTRIRASERLTHYNALNDERLASLIESIFPQLGRCIENGFDMSALGDYFVRMGKSSVMHGFPLSETFFGLRISQEIILKHMENEFVLDDSVALYQAVSLTAKVADFFMMGCYYLNRGFQEATIENLCKKEKISGDILKKYYKDDFFFKKED